jgi:hypothetical protein
MMNFHDDEQDFEPAEIIAPRRAADDETRYWTPRRVIYLIIALILIIALLSTLVWPLLWQIANPPPPPPTPPLLSA